MIATGGVAHAQESSIELSPEDSFWLEAKALDSPQAYQDYLQAYPVGRFASEAFRRLIERTKLGTASSDDDLPEPAAGPALLGTLAVADLY
jgi:hypothetical protein